MVQPDCKQHCKAKRNSNGDKGKGESISEDLQELFFSKQRRIILQSDEFHLCEHIPFEKTQIQHISNGEDVAQHKKKQ